MSATITVTNPPPTAALPPARNPGHVDLGHLPITTAPPRRWEALAAKAAQGKGPPSSIDWRGRERITNYRSQS